LYDGKRPFSDFLFLREGAGKKVHGYTPIEVIFFFLLGLHFANYVWSGLSKIIHLIGPTGAWMVDDPLYVYTPYMHIYDRISAAVPAGFEQVLYTMVKDFTPAFLLPSLAMQVICLIVIFHRKLMAIIPVMLDIFHSFVFLMAGILFYKWMVLNVGISYVFSKEKRKIPSIIKVLFVLICIFPFMAGTIKLYKLAWYDMFQFNTYDTYAVLKDGSKVDVPSNYFLNKSLHFSSIGLMTTFHQRFTGVGAWGGSEHAMVERTKTCDESLLIPINEEVVLKQREKFTRFFRQHHKYMLAKYDDNGVLPRFNFYPHHSFSDPYDAEDLRSIDFNDVVAYELAGIQGCLDPDLENPREEPNIVKEERWRIDVSDIRL